MMYEHTAQTIERIIKRDAEDRIEHNPLIAATVIPTVRSSYAFDVVFEYADSTKRISHSTGA
jgi:hypothetical protein